MSTPATSVTVTASIDGERAIARARKILDAGRAMSVAEQQAGRDDLYALMQAGDTIALSIVKAIYTEVDLKAAGRAAEAQEAARQSVLRDYERRRQEEWKDLSRELQAAKTLDFELNGGAVAKAFVRYAELLASAAREPPPNFTVRR